MPEITTTAPVVTATPATPAAKPAAGIADKVSGNPPAARTVDVQGDADDLGKWAKLSKEKREATSKAMAAETRAAELEKKLADLEGLRPVADKAGTVAKLVQEGKLTEAMKAAGVELDQAFAQWVAENEDNPAPAGPPKELIALQARLDAIEAAKKAEDDAKKAVDAEKLTAGQEAAKAETLKGISDKIATDGARWARCAKDPAEASADALGIVVEKVKALQRAVTDEEAAELFDMSLDILEAEYKAKGEKYYIAPAPKPTGRPHVSDYLPKPAPPAPAAPAAARERAVTLDGQRGSLRSRTDDSTKGRLSEADARTKAIAAARRL